MTDITTQSTDSPAARCAFLRRLIARHGRGQLDRPPEERDDLDRLRYLSHWLDVKAQELKPFDVQSVVVNGKWKSKPGLEPDIGRIVAIGKG